MTIYIFNPESSQAMSIARLLRVNSYKDKLVAVSDDDRSSKKFRKYYDDFISVKNAFLFKNKDCIFMPTGAVSTKALLSEGNVCINDIQLNVTALNVFDKMWIIKKASCLGIPVPKTWDNVDYIDNDDFPIFYKQKYEKGGGVRGVAKILSEIPQKYLNTLIFQEYIASQGTYGVGFIAKNGNVLVQFTHFEKESIPKEGGSAVFIEACANERLEYYTKRLLKGIEYSGWGLAEYKYCPKRKDFVFMEINAKFWASCEFAFRNEPMFMKLLFNVDIPKENILQLVFVNRVLERGLIFILKNIKQLFGSRFVVYPGVLKAFFKGILPEVLVRRIQKQNTIRMIEITD